MEEDVWMKGLITFDVIVQKDTVEMTAVKDQGKW